MDPPPAKRCNIPSSALSKLIELESYPEVLCAEHCPVLTLSRQSHLEEDCFVPSPQVTGVFVDRSAAMALQDEENMMLEEIQNRKRSSAKLPS